QPKFIVPSIRVAQAAGADVSGLTLACALWCRYCAGTTESGTAIAPNDPDWGRLTARAALARENPQAWLDMAEVYGSLGQDEFADEDLAFAESVLTDYHSQLQQEDTV
ncbi:hypothetical protein FM036_45025, partial [Nostoc sp. HG1]|nr:hypothetical protein [Nostoc sp. HG1]